MRTWKRNVAIGLALAYVACSPPRQGTRGVLDRLTFFDESHPGANGSDDARVVHPIALGSDFLLSVRGSDVRSVTVDPGEGMTVLGVGPRARLRAIGTGRFVLDVTATSGERDAIAVEVHDVARAELSAGPLHGVHAKIAERGIGLFDDAEVDVAVALFDEADRPLSGRNGLAPSLSSAGVAEIELVEDASSFTLRGQRNATGTATLSIAGVADLEVAAVDAVERIDVRVDGAEGDAISVESFGYARVEVTAQDRDGRVVFGNGGHSFEASLASATGTLALEGLEDAARTHAFGVSGQGSGTLRVRAAGVERSIRLTVTEASFE
jgi:hypothetical protein